MKLSTRQLCETLGVSKYLLGKWRAKKVIPYTQIGKKVVRYDLDEVKAALANYQHNAEAVK